VTYYFYHDRQFEIRKEIVMKLLRVLDAAMVLGGLILSFTGCGKSGSSNNGSGGLRSRQNQMNDDAAGESSGGSGE
jgi:hypothetical protein